MRRPAWLTLVRPNESDLTAVKSLFEECFTVSYSSDWFSEVIRCPKYFSILAKHDDQLIGAIICNFVPYSSYDLKKSQPLFSSSGFFTAFSASELTEPYILYVMSLCVTSEYRCKGVATLLLALVVTYFYKEGSNVDIEKHTVLNNLLLERDDVIDQLFSTFVKESSYRQCKAIYLHTPEKNSKAVEFYLARGFSIHCMVPNYYTINEKPENALIFVTRFLEVLDKNFPIYNVSSMLSFSLGSINSLLSSTAQLSCSILNILLYPVKRVAKSKGVVSNFSGVLLGSSNCRKGSASNSFGGFVSSTDTYSENEDTGSSSSDEDDYYTNYSPYQNNLVPPAPQPCLAPMENYDKGEDSPWYETKVNPPVEATEMTTTCEDDYDPNCLECKINLLNQKYDVDLPDSNPVERAAYIFEQEMMESSSEASSASSDEDDSSESV
ncbi:hypothetical protein Ciccas_006336 [Cichlidogyrus casuarinus]|uniref:N-alpha-acetyltransferase 60 n=1 Tax=Cichlidogyrus casuarinus TaxID=1844966 RepID=A0ABD2Q9V4_9PLAT